MTKLYAYILTGIILIAATAGSLWLAYSSGAKSGEQAERAMWQEATARAEVASREKEQADTTASEGARDAAAEEAREASDDTRDQKTQTIETIRYVYRDRPAACPDAGPLPDGVRDTLSAAHDALTSAAR